ncbi:MAG: hypothetical protein JKY22_09540 [Flavobacteriaceae bacterium]|nr:hypothetical protein [Flavobacteriaceae bacterium]
MSKSIKFLTALLGTLLVVFGIHLLVLDGMEKQLFAHKIVLAYVVNFALAAIILFLVQRNIKPNSAQAGFIFFGGSLLKFVVFFLVFLPSYKKNGSMETIEFITFFVPYVVCLILEVYFLSKKLNSLPA